MKICRIIAALSFMTVFGLTACGSDSSPTGEESGEKDGTVSSSSPAEEGSEEEEGVVETAKDLPSCKTKHIGDVYTVEDEETDYICSEDEEWVEVVAKVGDSCKKNGKTVYSKKDKEYFVCKDGEFEPVSDKKPSSSGSKEGSSNSETGSSDSSVGSSDSNNGSANSGSESSDSKVEGSSSSVSEISEPSSSSAQTSTNGTDVLGGAGEFTKNNVIVQPTGSEYTDVGVFKFYQWDANGNENGTISYIRNDDNEVVVQFYPTKNNSNIWDLQLEKDITIKAGYSYQIFIEGYDYGAHRDIHVGIQSLRGASGTSYENYISNEGSYWNTEEYNWKSGKALVCQTKTAQFYINAGGKKGEGIAIKSLKIIEEKMPSGICDGDVTGTDILSGNGEFMANDRIISPTGTDYTKVGVFNFYQWDADGNENGTIKYIRNLDSEVVVEFYPTKNNSHIWDLQLEKDITIKKGYAYQVVLQGYDYGTHRDIHVGIQSLFDENTPGASYENYISDEGSYWNTEENNWRSGKALVCQTKTAQFYINAGGNEGEGVALQTLKVLEQAMPSGICD